MTPFPKSRYCLIAVLWERCRRILGRRLNIVNLRPKANSWFFIWIDYPPIRGIYKRYSFSCLNIGCSSSRITVSTKTDTYILNVYLYQNYKDSHNICLFFHRILQKISESINVPSISKIAACIFIILTQNKTISKGVALLSSFYK